MQLRYKFELRCQLDRFRHSLDSAKILFWLGVGGCILYIKYPNTKSYNPNLLPVEKKYLTCSDTNNLNPKIWYNTHQNTVDLKILFRLYNHYHNTLFCLKGPEHIVTFVCRFVES